MTDESQLQFSVDTGLFRQLGELLVGRDSTALIELVKNAYDADATSVVISGLNLYDPGLAEIRVVDNGTGMTSGQFARGFLRLAARSKVFGERRSPVYRRRFTGEKGVGRLAAHKLGALLEVQTIAVRDDEQGPVDLRRDLPSMSPADMRYRLERSPKQLVLAKIDWDLIEEHESVSAIREGLDVSASDSPVGSPTGTDIRITRLRHPWMSQDLAELATQLESFSPPEALVMPLGRSVVERPLLFDRPRVRDAGIEDPGMTIDLQGEFGYSEHHWPDVVRSADWVLEIRAARDAQVLFSMSPTAKGVRDNPFAERFSTRIPHPAPVEGPFFDARILLRSGPVPGLHRGWFNTNSGIRVYLEGFRVLPYGESKNDWLGLDLDYTRRAGRIELNPALEASEYGSPSLNTLRSRDVSLRLQPNRNFFGAVFISEEGSGGLRSLVNREGFVPDESYQRLVELVRTGTDLLHRAWALASLRKKQAAHEKRSTETAAAGHDAEGDPGEVGGGIPASRGDKNSGQSLPASRPGSEGSGARLLRLLGELRVALREGMAGPQHASEAFETAMGLLADADEAAGDLIADASLMRVLASVGSQLAAFTHEVGHLIPTARAAELQLEPRAGERWPTRVAEVREAVRELRRAVERQALYLTDVSSSDARRRRTRLRLRERVDVAFLTAQTAAASRDVVLRNEVDDAIKTPPMFRADMQSILANLISNALKAANTGGEIVVTAETTGDVLDIIVSNTGESVDSDSSENLFQPYVSNATITDPVLGQGMGLGLPITRQLVAEYGGTVRFVPARRGYATSIEVRLPF